MTRHQWVDLALAIVLLLVAGTAVYLLIYHPNLMPPVGGLG